jgi:hypothetical protein
MVIRKLTVNGIWDMLIQIWGGKPVTFVAIVFYEAD